MFIKRKSILVIFLSSTIIALVLVMTLVGFYLYLNWTLENDKNLYKNALYELTAKLFEKYISVADIVLKIESEGQLEGEPVVEGHIVNKTNKKVLSIKMKVSVSDNDSRVLYTESFYPLGQSQYLAVIKKETGNYLAPNDAISFKHLLKNCPKEILTYLRMKTRFAKEKKSQSLGVNYKIEELIFG